MAAGTQLPPQLIKFWSRAGKGGQLINWGAPGDFNRCRTEINAAIVKGGGKPLADSVISGLCNTLHQLNNGGAAPGHAPGEHTGH